MCGRYTIKDVQAVMPLIRAIKNLARDLRPTFNAAPSQLLPVVRVGEDGERELVDMRWGLVPFWDKTEKPKFAPINARSEDALGKATFKQSLQKRRCLVPADGFFEWKKLDAAGKLKVPYHIQLRGSRPFMFAGIFEAGSGDRPETFAFLTTGPNAVMEPIHNRMPVILGPDEAEAWARPGTLDSAALGAFAAPFPADQMEAYTVSRLVNSPHNNSPECVRPESDLELELGEGGPNSA
jgi:putative SOS response-associated peptidase YedK